ncbi:MAG: glycine-rich domain-containing protein, partial [Verrucomicrobiota bacterium]
DLMPSDITGTVTWYAGGGGGATLTATRSDVGLGGTGGGGAGGRNYLFTYYDAVNGTANTGGGGGGACSDNSAGNGGSGIVIISYPQTAGASPIITGGTLSAALSSTYGTASSATSFTLSGVNMTAGILVTAPAGFEVSKTSGSGYAGSTTVGAAGTIATTTVYVRLSATAPASGTYNSKNIVLSSSGATSVNVPTTASGNSVSKATPIATLTVSNSPVTYNGSPHAATCAISASSVTGTVQNILIGGASNQSDVGSYPVTADFVPSDTANYDTLTGLAAGDFVILTTFTTWIDTYYTGEVNPLIVGPDADPDQDGQPNFLEFALNSNPSNASSSGKAFVKMATVGAVPNVLTLSVAVRDYAGAFTADGNNQTALDPNDGITYHIEASTTLGNWGALLVTQVPDTDAAIIQASLPTPAAGWSYKTFSTDSASRAAFIRVKVTTP